MTTTEEAREELAKVVSLVLTARRLVATGTLVDLSAIEDRVRVFCDAIEEMPREDGQVLLEDMRALIGKLDRLAADLQDHLGQLSAKRAELNGGA